MVAAELEVKEGVKEEVEVGERGEEKKGGGRGACGRGRKGERGNFVKKHVYSSHPGVMAYRRTESYARISNMEIFSQT